MIVLAFDCSLASCSAAVYDSVEDRVLAEEFARMEKGQAEALAPMVRDVMARAKIGFGEVARIAVTLGPGTFTGIRIGLAFAKGLALALKCPVSGIDTLTAISVEADAPGFLAVVNEARRDDVYAAVFNGPGRRISGPVRCSLSEAAALLPSGPVTIMGNAKSRLIGAAGRSDLTSAGGCDLPIAAKFARLALVDMADMPLRPLYLAESYAKLPAIAMPARKTIDIAPIHDATVLAALHAACFEPGWTTADFARLLAMPGAFAMIASHDDEPAAFLLLRGAGDEAEIITIGTLPTARRRGLAERLVAESVRHLRASGVTSLIIEVAQSNAPALFLYRKLGFGQAGLRTRYYERPDGTREDAFIMRKDIAA